MERFLRSVGVLHFNVEDRKPTWVYYRHDSAAAGVVAVGFDLDRSVILVGYLRSVIINSVSTKYRAVRKELDIP